MWSQSRSQHPGPCGCNSTSVQAPCPCKAVKWQLFHSCQAAAAHCPGSSPLPALQVQEQSCMHAAMLLIRLIPVIQAVPTQQHGHGRRRQLWGTRLQPS